ncbi:hypothetical protein ACFV2I_33380 [Streptomyces microflavus]|uniref:hypothetical protein n=1 Tax=Streptomyces microflavus TaxID=1919 RepID=UPI0036835695
MLNLGLLFEELELDQGLPTGGRIGGVALTVMCALLVALITYALNPDEPRGPRWAATASAFTGAMGVLAVAVKVVG